MKRKDDAEPLPTQFQGPGESPGFLLWKISNAWQRRQRAALQPFGLTHSQFVILATSTWFGATEVLTQARIAQITGIDPMTTSQVVRALEAAALLSRRNHPDDPRAKAIVVTAEGRDRAKKALKVVEETDHAFFEAIGSSTPRLVKLFQTLLQADDASAADD